MHSKFLRNHPRLLVAVACGILSYFVLPAHLPVLSRVLVAWNAAALAYLTLILRWMATLSAEQICRRFDEEDESMAAISIVVVSAAVLSLAAIVAMLATARQVAGGARLAHTALAALTLICSWMLVPTVFTSQYAQLFYAAAAERRPLRFPRTEMPVFWDFAYFSFTISCACQTADVSTTETPIRRVVLAQTVVSFLFNAAILGFAINVGAGLVGG